VCVDLASDEVLEAIALASRRLEDTHEVLGLGLGRQALVLGLGRQFIGLGPHLLGSSSSFIIIL